MTPHDISVLLHHYVSPEPWPLGSTDAYESSIDWMEREGIIEWVDSISGGGFVLTKRGDYLVDDLCRTPLPMTPLE